MPTNNENSVNANVAPRSGLVGLDPAEATEMEVEVRFAELAKEVRAAGLLQLKPLQYYGRLAFNIAFAGVGLLAFFLIGDSWWQLAVAPWMGLCAWQSAFMWHDTGHKAMFRGPAATAMGRFHANPFNGGGHGRWAGHHNRRHSFPNEFDFGPDIGRRTATFSVSQYAKRDRRQRFIVRHQRTLFFMLLVLESCKKRRTSLLTPVRGGLRRPWVEGLLMLANVVIYLSAVFLVLSPLRAAAFIVVQQACWASTSVRSARPTTRGWRSATVRSRRTGWSARS